MRNILKISLLLAPIVLIGMGYDKVQKDINKDNVLVKRKSIVQMNTITMDEAIDYFSAKKQLLMETSPDTTIADSFRVFLDSLRAHGIKILDKEQEKK